MAESVQLKLTIKGFLYPFKGARFLIAHPGLLSLVAIPVGINTLLYSLLIWFTYSRLGGWLESIVQRGEGWYWAILYYILLFLAAFLLIIVVFYTFTLVGNLILAPFNEIISEKVELVYSGSVKEDTFSIGAFFRDMARSYRAEGGRIALYLVGFLALLLLNLVPIAGTVVYGVAVTLYSLFFLCWEFLDYPMERWRFTFASKRKTAFRNMPVFLSFGAGAALLLVIPFLNLAAIPVCVAGASLLFCDLRKEGRLPEIERRGDDGK